MSAAPNLSSSGDFGLSIKTGEFYEKAINNYFNDYGVDFGGDV